MEVIMPKMGESVNEGTIIKWHKKIGDLVKMDEIIFEISTDKVDTEIPAPCEGVLSEIKVNEGETVLVGTVVALIAEKGEGSSNESAEVSDKASENSTASESQDKTVLQSKEGKEKKLSDELDSAVNKEAEKDNAIAPVPSTPSIPSAVSPNNSNLVEIAMPKMGESVMEGTIIKWYKRVGDKIKKDETIFGHRASSQTV